MKQNHYESVVIINAALEDEQINSIISKIEEYLKNKESEITETERWGRKRLAYPIQKSKSGYYVIFRFIAETSVISGLERMYRLDENIIRYLTVALDAKALEDLALQKEKAAQEAVITPEVTAQVEEEPKSIVNEDQVSEA